VTEVGVSAAAVKSSSCSLLFTHQFSPATTPTSGHHCPTQTDRRTDGQTHEDAYRQTAGQTACLTWPFTWHDDGDSIVSTFT